MDKWITLYIIFCWHIYSPFALWLYAWSQMLLAGHAIVHCCLYSYLLHKQQHLSDQCTQLNAFIKKEVWIYLKETRRKQGKCNGNSETVTTLIPNAYVPAVSIWNGKLSPKKRMTEAATFQVQVSTKPEGPSTQYGWHWHFHKCFA